MPRNTSTFTAPTTENEGWGFYGTMGGHAENVWPVACQELHKRYQASPERIRELLDSRLGRFIADSVQDQMVCNGLSATKATRAAIKVWHDRYKLAEHVAGTYRQPRRFRR